MALVKAHTAAEGIPVNYENTIAAKIQQRRYQILVHSLLYYELNINLVDDSQWSSWAKELAQLQDSNPAVASKVIFADAFRGFDGSTGYHLPYTDEQIVNIAYRLLLHDKTAEGADALHRLQYGVKRTPAEYEQYKKRSHCTPRHTASAKEVKSVEPKQRKGLFSVPRK